MTEHDASSRAGTPASAPSAADLSVPAGSSQPASVPAMTAAEPSAAAGPRSKSARKSPDRLGTMRVGKLLLEFSIPAIVSMIFNSLYNVVDTAFLGWAVGDAGVAVTTLALPVMNILMGFSMIAGQGGNALSAIQLGEGRKADAERTLGNSATLLIVLAVAVAVASIVLIDPVLALIGTTPDLYEPTKSFVQIVCVGFMFQSLGLGLNNFLRTVGKPVFALVTMVIGTLVCVVLNAWFVLGLGWGVAGSAYATVLGQACGMVPVLWYFVFNRHAVLRLRLSLMTPDLRLMARILALGLASFVMQVAATAVNIVANQLLTFYGAADPLGSTGALAAIGTAMKVIMFTFVPVIGLIMGAQPIIGYNYGAGNWQRVLDTLKWASVAATVMMLFFWALVHLIPEQIIGLFGITGELRDFTVTVLKIDTILFPVIGFQVVGSSYFQSSGQPLKAAILEMTRQVIFLIPLYLVLPIVLPAFGITPLTAMVVAVPGSDLLACVTTAIFVVLEVKRLRRKRDAANALAAEPEGIAA